MKIAILSKADSYGGGASRIADELNQLLNQKGYDSHHWLKWKGNHEAPSKWYLYGQKFGKYFDQIDQYVKKVGLPDFVPFELLTLLKNKRIHEYDILHFHDLSSAISPLTVWYLSKLVPTVWTIHDCSPYTGGCLYPMDCVKFQSKCGPCPQLGQWPIDTSVDLTGWMHSVKKKMAQSGRIVYVTPSQWMADQAWKSNIFISPPVVLPNGVDTENFKPYNKTLMRQKLGLPIERKIILISAGYIRDERKGAKYSLDAIRQIKDLNPYLLVVGNMNDDDRKILQEFEYYETGYIGDKEKLSQVYAAAELFLFCSLADNMPLCVLETMATATPIVGFKTGGIPEMVDQDQTGYLVPVKDSEQLAEKLRYGLDPQVNQRWALASREKVQKEYSYDVFVEKHIQLYQKILSGELLLHQNKN